MVNWSYPGEIALDSDVFERMIFISLGVTIWEFFTTCDFEWSLIRGRRRFRWPLVFLFFLSRYCILLAFIGLIISISITTRVNCWALYIFNSWAGNMTFLCSSTSLMLRTIALWERKLRIIAPLCLLCLAFWTIGYRTMFIVQANWDDAANGCIVTNAQPSLLNILYFFNMAFDLTILIYTYVALTTKHTARTDLWRLLFHDGLVYFLVTFGANCIPAVFNVLNLNSELL
ncbi:hypothetical protein BDP27DRAFT_1389322 [Rhodocollybia butyracea]|uniref:Uncharacterized protein n=1 Tax=Rhodocollybia butyracea TaxID=206335 RepID=A0A9P5Q774_9AGAR|nr:hypothetical protein BDP27DRAFT_1389322 [Rhodocollybia butyracea]